ncbi:MAG TPA: hypothetical protein VJ840_12270 [Gemmatimonadaceae bacterium]|nr:hypothetical protein [Gemmatimonadaceae bacterium]
MRRIAGRVPPLHARLLSDLPQSRRHRRPGGQLAAITRAPIFFVGDLRDGGPDYARDVLAALARIPVSNRIVFEFFDPPDASLVEAIDASVRHWGAELSPESHDESIRAHLGKARFTNVQMETAIEALLPRDAKPSTSSR